MYRITIIYYSILSSIACTKYKLTKLYYIPSSSWDGFDVSLFAAFAKLVIPLLPEGLRNFPSGNSGSEVWRSLESMAQSSSEWEDAILSVRTRSFSAQSALNGKTFLRSPD